MRILSTLMAIAVLLFVTFVVGAVLAPPVPFMETACAKRFAAIGRTFHHIAPGYQLENFARENCRMVDDLADYMSGRRG